jgi:phage regulator Rha-like protein
MLNNITVQTNSDGTLVVDSRLIAERLGVQHETFMRTLKKYEPELEEAFGVIRFEIHQPPKGSQGGRPETFALLTEEQATTAMTFSRNTPEVLQCKIDLVTAFKKAKDLLTGKVEHPSALKPVRDVVEYIEAAKTLQSLKVNPQLKQLLEDGLVDEMALMRTNSKAIAPATKEYTIVKVRATELGYTHKEIENGSLLGRYVSKRLNYAFKKRIGDFEVMHYLITPELDSIIHEYFAR